jgi:hypothetical protein
MNQPICFTRRTMLIAGVAATGAAIAQAQSAALAGRRLTFDIWRDKHRIGRHSLAFSGGETDPVVAIDARIAVSLGPIALYNYHHQATETWRDGQFASLQSLTITNGKREQVSAVRTPAGVAVKTLDGVHTLSHAASPLTHWNERALQGPLFNPETGAPLRESVSRQSDQTLRISDAQSVTATRYALSGDANITDWYDAQGVWAALRAKAPDGSYVDYSRLS